MVEAMVTFTMLVAVLSAVAVGIRSGHLASEEIRRSTEISRQASELLDRLTRIDYGSPMDPAPTGAQLTELFDDDDQLGGVTLVSMRMAPATPGFTFQMANFRYGGTWEVRISADLNNDGDQVDDAEGLDEILRINIYYNNRLVLQTLRASPFA